MDSDSPCVAPTVTVRRHYSERFGKVAHAVMHDPTVRLGAKAVYAALATYADAADRSLYVKQRTLAEGLGVTDRTLRNYLRELEAAGYLVTQERTARQRGGVSNARVSNDYVLLDGHLMVAPASKPAKDAAAAADDHLFHETLAEAEYHDYADEVVALARARGIKAPGRWLAAIEVSGGPSGVAGAVERLLRSADE